MAMPRESAFLPTIKCSSCGNQVEISMMGEHICSGDDLEEMNNVPAIPAKYSLDKQSHLPPPLDTSAANRGYGRPPAPMSSTRNHFEPSTPRDHYGQPRGADQAGAGHYGNTLPSQSQSQSTRRPGGYGGFGGSTEQDSGDNYMSRSLGQQGGGLMQRMGTMAPGPFDTGRRPSAPNFPPVRKDSFDRYGSSPGSTQQMADRPSTSHAHLANNEALPSPRLPRKNGYGGFGPPSMQSDNFEPGALSRAETFPKPSYPNDVPSRTPSAPGERPDQPTQQRTGFENGRRPSAGPDTSRPAPPRTSLIRPSAAGKQQSKAAPNLAAEFGVGNPYHTPSDSASSGYSNFSGTSRASSQTSPARSQSRRQPSEENIANSSSRMVDNLRMQELRVDPRAQPTQQPLRTPSPLVESPFSMSPRENNIGSPKQGRGYNDASRSPQDRNMPSRYGSSPRQETEREYFSPSIQAPRRTNTEPDRLATSPPLPMPGMPLRKASQPSRGDCKACHLPIRGKSVSSADGRLTGKYHKACFVCTTCSRPFTSAEFYVLNNKPFCEQHYHKLNGSLCGSCNRGIEGQYAEDETLVKYHVGCFRCLDCGRSLSDGYFEVEGKSYCEADAWKRVQQASAWPDAAAQAPPPPPAPAADPEPKIAAAPSSNAPTGRRVPPPTGAMGLPRNPAPRSKGAQRDMGRGPYGVPSADRAAPKMNKRMTRIGVM